MGLITLCPNALMMKPFITLFLIFGTSVAAAQANDNKAVENAITTFFEHFHRQDTAAMKAMAYPGLNLQTIGRDKEGTTRVRTVAFSKFLESIGSIPDSIQFQEKIKGIAVQTDGPLAHAWTPYEFWINGQRSHCGVNSFQFVKTDGQWKIIYLVDTRRRDNCD